MLIKQKPNIKAFHDDNGQDLLAKGEVDLVLEYNGDIAQAMVEDDDIDFVIPKEGSQLNSDTLCIPKGAQRPKNAHAFINYLLDAEAGKKITETILYPTPNAAAKALMPDNYKNNPVIFPAADSSRQVRICGVQSDIAAALRRGLHPRPRGLTGGGRAMANRTGKSRSGLFAAIACAPVSWLLLFFIVPMAIVWLTALAAMPA